MEPVTAAPLPDDFEVLSSLLDPQTHFGRLVKHHERHRNSFEVRRDKLTPSEIADLMHAVLGASTRYSREMEEAKRAHRTLHRAYGFCQLSGSEWVPVNETYEDLTVPARDRLAEMNRGPEFLHYLGNYVCALIAQACKGPMYKRKGEITVSLIELKQRCGQISEAERFAWLGEFLVGNFDAKPRTSSVSRNLRGLGYPFGWTGTEVRGVLLDSAAWEDTGRQGLPKVHGYECFPLNELAPLFEQWREAFPLPPIPGAA